MSGDVDLNAARRVLQRAQSRGRPGLARKYYEITRASRDDGIWITTADRDLENDRVVPEGMDLALYEKIGRPVLWLHDGYGVTASAGIPIGTSRALQVVPGRGIRSTGIDWLEGDEFAERVRNAWDQGKINAASIGFIPTHWVPNEFGGHDILKAQMLEWSLGPLPANVHAIRDGLTPEAIVAATAKIFGEAGLAVRRPQPGAPTQIPREGIYLSREELRALIRHVRVRAALRRLQLRQLVEQFPFLAQGDGLACVDYEKEISHARGFGEFYD